MINRWNLDEDITNLVESVLKNPPLNSIHPNYVDMPNPELKYRIIKGRKLYECENNDDLTLYTMSDDIKEKSKDNCHFLCECYVIVGVVRKKDTYISDFHKIKSALTMFFGASGMEFMHTTLTDGNDTIENARLGNFGISKVEIQSTRKTTDKCGVCNFEVLVKFSIYFIKFQQ